MKRTGTLLLLLTFSLSAATPVATPVAKFESVTGTVQYRVKGGHWENAKLGAVLLANTELQTGPRGKAVLIFQNGSKVSLSPGTLVSLDQYTTGAYGSQTNMSLRIGRVNADIAKLEGTQRNHFRVRTPTVVAGVRGTLEEVGYSPDKGTEVKLEESSSDLVDKTGHKTHVPEGGKSDVSHHGTHTADQTESKDNTVTITSEEASSGGEQEMSMTSGDFSFTSNTSDFTDFFNFFDQFAQDEFLLFDNTVTFQKL